MYPITFLSKVWWALESYSSYLGIININYWNHISLVITIFINLGLLQHFEKVTNIRTWIKSHIYWRLL